MNPDRFSSIPYLDQGRDYDGCDCYGLVWLWFRDVLGIALDRYDGVTAADVRAVRAMIERHKREWITVDTPRDHDVAVMRPMNGGRGDGHLGLVVERRSLMHITDPVGVQVERLSSPHIAMRVIEFRRHPSFA